MLQYSGVPTYQLTLPVTNTALWGSRAAPPLGFRSYTDLQNAHGVPPPQAGQADGTSAPAGSRPVRPRRMSASDDGARGMRDFVDLQTARRSSNGSPQPPMRPPVQRPPSREPPLL